MRKLHILTTVVLFLLLSCVSSKVPPHITHYPALDLDSRALVPAKAILLKDNDLAYASKIDIIRNAGKELRLMYYIFNPDQSTSFLTTELIRKVEADKDFRIKILVDYHWNYKNLDFFRWLESQQPFGVQQISVRFYNRPTVNIIKFAEFMTIGCQDGILADSLGAKPACSNEKLDYLTKFDGLTLPEAEEAMSVAAKIFLAGLYSKDPNVLLYAFQFGYARTIKQLTESSSPVGAPDKEQLGQLKKLAQLYWQSRFASGPQRLGARLKLTLAGIFFGKTLNPVIDAMETFLPFTLKDTQDNPLLAHSDLDYLTDYIHHKYILADTRSLQIGGRNLENSYHMQPNSLTEKYTFMDTDIFMELNEVDGNRIQSTFDELWDFEAMVATTEDISRHAPISYVYMIREATREADEICGKEKDMLKQQSCAGNLVADYISKGKQSFIDAKMEEWGQAVLEAKDEYIRAYLSEKLPSKNWTTYQQLFDSQKGYVQEAKVYNGFHTYAYQEIPGICSFYYVENLPFYQEEKVAADKKRRSYGSEYGEEVRSGKIIHKVWTDAISEACRKSQGSVKPIEVIIHQGYFSPPAGLIQLMDHILEAGESCPNVKLKIYTNSKYSTDLAPVSFLGRRQLFALSRVHDLKNANFEYFEYDKEKLDQVVRKNYSSGQPDPNVENGASFSLHTKVMIFGNDIYIGSSNADIRSYMMDTNNGVFIKNAPQLVNRYKDFLEELETKQIVHPAPSTFDFPDEETLRAKEKMDIEELIVKYGMERHLQSEERQKHFHEIMKQIEWVMKVSSDLTYEIVKENKLDKPCRFDGYFKMM